MRRWLQSLHPRWHETILADRVAAKMKGQFGGRWGPIVLKDRRPLWEERGSIWPLKRQSFGIHLTDTLAPPDRARSQRLPRLTPLRVIGGLLALGVLALISGFLLLWALFSWFRPHFDRSDVLGVYVAKYPSGTETIELKEDGTFLQEVALKEQQNATPVTRTGAWTFDEDEQTVTLPGCMPVARMGDISPTFQTALGHCTFPVERAQIFFGVITLSGDRFPPTEKVD
jgi:hypothetical protein